MPRKKLTKREYEFINRDIVAGLTLALTQRPCPTDDELGNDAALISFYQSVYKLSDKLQALGYSKNMPLYWLQQEFPKIGMINPDNPNAIYPKNVLDLYDTIKSVAPVIAETEIPDEDLMPDNRI